MSTTDSNIDLKDYHAAITMSGLLRVRAYSREDAWLKAKEFVKHNPPVGIVVELDTFDADIQEVEEW